MMRCVFVLCTVLAPVCACAQPHPFEGVWIWDKARYVPPPGMKAMAHMVEETMSVTRDDGAHYASAIRQVFDDGAVVVLNEDFAEDGKDHAIAGTDPTLMVGITVLPDGGRRVVSRQDGEIHDSTCHVSDAGRTLICPGTHTARDGSTGDYVCVYHRDPHVIAVSALARRGAGRVA